MTPTKILIGQAFVVMLIIAAAIWAATHYVAAAFGFDPALGKPWSQIGETPVYYPWRLFEWWYAYEAYAPEIFMQGGAIAAAGGMVGAGAAIAGSLWRARQQRNVTTYGSARWAKRSDISGAGLFDPNGVFLDKWRGSYLRHDGPEHVMAFAPTRSGKGVGLIVPTLLSWTGSAVIHDIKGENWMLTSGWRSRFSHCLLFDPTNLKSARYNPLLEVRKGEGEVRDVQNIADILVDPEGSLEQRSHWEKNRSRASRRRHSACSLYRGRKDPCARRVVFVRPKPDFREDPRPDESDQPSGNGSEAAGSSRRRAGRARTSEQVGKRALRPLRRRSARRCSPMAATRARLSGTGNRGALWRCHRQS